MEINQNILKDNLSYDPNTGLFFRLKKLGRMANLSKPAGYINDKGYVVIKVKNRLFKAHRLAWLYVFGEFPYGEIDHKNGNRSDNRLINLRDVSRNLNQQNQRKSRADSKAGLLGVHFDARLNKYKSQITVNRKKRYLGLFDTAIEAHTAYLNAKRSLHESCTI